MEQRRKIICTGPSMFPTLLPGDGIETEEIAFAELRSGDIIVYNNPENIRQNIIHRVIGRDANGMITRGDNNSQIDPYRVRPEHYPLKVVAVERGSRRLPVGGYGMNLHRLRILQMKLRKLKAGYLYPVYAFVADSGIFHFIGAMLKTEVRRFKRPKGIECQLFLGKRRIGTLCPGAEKWQIRFPWRLFVKAPEADGK